MRHDGLDGKGKMYAPRLLGGKVVRPCTVPLTMQTCVCVSAVACTAVCVHVLVR